MEEKPGVIIEVMEHSRLLYLIASLRAAPQKAQRLLNMARDSGASVKFNNALDRLERASKNNTLAIECQQLRNEWM